MKNENIFLNRILKKTTKAKYVESLKPKHIAYLTKLSEKKLRKKNEKLLPY